MKVRQDKFLEPRPDGNDGRWALSPILVRHVKRTVELPFGCCPIDTKPMEVVEVLEENPKRPLVRVHGSTQEAVNIKEVVTGSSVIENVLEEAGILRP